MPLRKRVAIVGSGCAGIGALWALQSTEHEVHLFESADRLGGHTNTVTYEQNGKTTNVDTGFMVLNTATYPNFIAFLKVLGVPTVPTSMTFGVSRDQGAFEWAGTSLSAVFAQRSNLFSGRVWRMLFDIVRFNQFALDLLSVASESENEPSGSEMNSSAYEMVPRQETIGHYLEREGYSQAFRDDYLIPMTAAIWSTSPEKCDLEFPAVTLIRFMWNHHLLTVFSSRPPWLTIKGGTRQYIDAVMDTFPQERVHLGAEVKSLKNKANGQVELLMQDSGTQSFDHVILATHGDQAMGIVHETATPEEIEILSKFKTSANTAVLHSDLSFMPKRSEAWSAWNLLTTTKGSTNTVSSVCLTYCMNILQHIPARRFGDVLITLNPSFPPKPETVQGSWTYHHPLYNAAAIWSQTQLPHIQNTRGISYAGAWTKYGFHEDGFSSGVKVAMEHLGARIPFEFVDSTFSRGKRPEFTWRDHLARIVILWFYVIMLLGLTILGQVRNKFLGKGRRMQKCL